MADDKQGNQITAEPQTPAPTTPEPTIPLSWQVFTWQQWLVVIVGSFLLAQFIQRPLPNESSGHGPIAVVDMERMLRAKSLSVAASGMNDIAAEADAFSKKMKVEIDGLTSRGIVVIGANNAVAWPKAIDITDMMASRLGVDMKLVDEDDKLRAQRLQQLIERKPATSAPAAPR
jgi:hypothetical protein